MNIEEIAEHIDKLVQAQVNKMLGGVGKEILETCDLRKQFKTITETATVFDKWVEYNTVKYDDAIELVETAIHSKNELGNLITNSDKRTVMMFVVLCEMANAGVDIFNPQNIKDKAIHVLQNTSSN